MTMACLLLLLLLLLIVSLIVGTFQRLVSSSPCPSFVEVLFNVFYQTAPLPIPIPIPIPILLLLITPRASLIAFLRLSLL